VSRLADIAQLREGWNGPASQPIHPRAIAAYVALSAAFDGRLPAALEPFPWVDGGLCLEWDRHGWTYFADLQPDGGMWLSRIQFGEDDSEDEEHTYPLFDAVVLKRFYDTGRIQVPE
jgi:hypothetical protein